MCLLIAPSGSKAQLSVDIECAGEQVPSTPRPGPAATPIVKLNLICSLKQLPSCRIRSDMQGWSRQIVGGSAGFRSWTGAAAIHNIRDKNWCPKNPK